MLPLDRAGSSPPSRPSKSAAGARPAEEAGDGPGEGYASPEAQAAQAGGAGGAQDAFAERDQGDGVGEVLEVVRPSFAEPPSLQALGIQEVRDGERHEAGGSMA